MKESDTLKKNNLQYGILGLLLTIYIKEMFKKISHIIKSARIS